MAPFSLLAGRFKIDLMKKIITLVCAGAFLMLTAFVQAGGIDEVINAFRGGNTTVLSKYLDDTVEIKLPSKSDSYSRSQAVVILQDFFQNNQVKGFETKFKGDNGGSEYCIGTLQTRSGSYRTTFFMANRNGKQLLREIRMQNN
jgi:antitoxin component YwqK of YwqJK toxin-antitoxin module